MPKVYYQGSQKDTALEEQEIAEITPQPPDTVTESSEEQEVPSDIVEPTKRSGLSSLLREVVETVLLTLVIFVIINTLTGRFRIEGPSMKETLHEGQYLIINKVVYQLHPPQRGDVIVFHHPQDPTRDLIKRVLGLPGEVVETRRDKVYINGVLLEEPYVTYHGGRSTRYELGKDEFFVMGDNRPNSDDSRNWGAVPEELIIGKSWISYWPPSIWGGGMHYDHPQNIERQE
jgi:signal peptidase I